MSYTSESQNNASNNKYQEDGIIEVYQHNFVSEIKHLSVLLEKYNYVGMDTEFPGIVYNLKYYTNEFYYKTIKINVDSLKLIQVGLTLSDVNGNKPSDSHTWQFNLKFNYKKDSYCSSSIDLLNECGVNFEKMYENGIPFDLFGEYLISSGLVLNEDINWIVFHGTYDFAYLLKTLTNSPLPNTEKEFFEDISLYFPNIYDVKYLVKGDERLYGGLNRLGNYLNVNRKGIIHQAGSDSNVTLEVYFKLIEKNYVNSSTLEERKNIIYGIGDGADENELLSYSKIGNNLDHVMVNNYQTSFSQMPMQTN